MEVKIIVSVLCLLTLAFMRRGRLYTKKFLLLFFGEFRYGKPRGGPF